MNVGVTVIQLVLMPVIKALLGTTALVDTPSQALPIGDYFIFDYTAGPLPAGGGGLAYFLAVLITTWGLGASGEAIADVATMLINALISCAVFFPIFKLIFRREDEAEVVTAENPRVVVSV